ncbi:DUF6580 family putative transport protein [Chitinophaga lutea]
MSVKNLQPRFLVLLLFIVVAGAMRIASAGQLMPFANFSPVGAMALFGGAMFAGKWKSYLFPLLVLFISDVITMQTVYRPYANGLLFDGWYWNYIGFAAMVLVGQLIITKVSVARILIACGVAAVAHWLIADFGTWMSPANIDLTTGQPYTKDWAGLMKCYAMGLPYLKNTLVSNVIYAGIFFGAFKFMEQRIPALAVKPLS